MEIRAIDANALFDALYDNEFQTFCPLDEVSDVIDAAPTLDYEPVRHGEWAEETMWIGSFGQIRTTCSVCGTTYPDRPGSRGDGKGGKFCGECGAKMGD